MKYSELSADEREFLEAVDTAKNTSKAEYLSFIAMILYETNRSLEEFPAIRSQFEDATRGDLKRAIKRLREVQSRFSYPEDIDAAIGFIRENWLNREVAV